jgi:hypothetical protein
VSGSTDFRRELRAQERAVQRSSRFLVVGIIEGDQSIVEICCRHQGKRGRICMVWPVPKKGKVLQDRTNPPREVAVKGKFTIQ